MHLKQHIDRSLALTATGITLVVSALSTNAQNWETLLDLSAPNGGDARGHTLLVDPYSRELAPLRLLVGGEIATEPAVLQATVMIFDQSTGTYDRHDVPGAFSANQLGVDPSSGNLFSATAGRWQLSKSSDGGTNWTLADTFALSTNASAYAQGFAADDYGNLFLAGVVPTPLGPTHWVVRKSTDHGQSWTTVDTADNSPNAFARRIYSVPGTNGGLFVVGYRNSGGWWTWTVRRSRDGGATWSTVDSGPEPGAVEGYANGITSDGAGNVYVVGRSGGWTVRSSSNGGDTWQTVYAGDPTYPAGATDIVVDRTGSLWITGGYNGGWAALRRDASGVWQPMDFLGPAGDPTGPLSQGEAVAVDRAGNVFVTGWIRDAIGLPIRWVIQRRLSGTPVLRTAALGQNLVLSWPASYQGFILQSATTLVNGGDWQDSNLIPTVTGDQNVVNVSATNATGFFRIHN
jgi:hypothetical protein